jgi:hypothetical protein
MHGFVGEKTKPLSVHAVIALSARGQNYFRCLIHHEPWGSAWGEPWGSAWGEPSGGEPGALHGVSRGALHRDNSLIHRTLGPYKSSSPGTSSPKPEFPNRFL